MSNDKNTLRRTVAVCLLATLGVANHVVHADELGVVVGSLDGYRSLAVNYQSAPLWQGTLVAHPLDVSLEGSVAKIVKLEHAWRRLDGRNDDGFQVAPFPG